jgi:uncharacterized protein (DUF305 family)
MEKKMKKRLIVAPLSAAVLTLSACGGTDEPADNVAAENDMNAMMADAGPFADIEMRMNDAMLRAVGVNAGDSWTRKMMEHHKGAVEMSRQVLTMNPDAHVAEMARSTIDKRTAEIAELEKLLVQGSPDPASAAIYRPAIERMHQAMMAATGADLSETFHRKMLAHHQGAVALSDIALANGVTGAIREQVEQTKAAQQQEIETIEAMLRGEPAPAAAAETQPRSSAPAAQPPEPRPGPSKPAPAEPAEPAPEPADPHAGHDMNNMSS